MRLNPGGDEGSYRRRLGESEAVPPEHDRGPRSSAPKSLANLYRDHSARLLRYFSRRGSARNADDLVQETFVRMAGNPVEIEQPHAYINRVATNLLREQARFAARRSAALHVSADDVPLAGPDPVAQLEARDMLERLEVAMARMKPAIRETFMAHRIDGYTYSEIAQRTGRSVKIIEKQIAKAVFLVNRSMRGR